MASPRYSTPDSGTGSTGSSILDNANNALTTAGDPSGPTALDSTKPAHSSPLKSSTIAADIDSEPASATTSSASPDVAAEPATGPSGTVETVLNALGGAIVAAPVAALESISTRFPEAVAAAKDSTLGNNLANAASNASEHVQSYAQQAAAKLPASVTSQLPTQLTRNSTGTTDEIPGSTSSSSHHSEMKIDSESRETTSAAVLETGLQRPQAVFKAPVPGGSSSSSAAASSMPAPVGRSDSDDFTKPHTVGNFEASGSLQSTQNPSMLEAQSDLAARAEAGDL